MHMAQPKRAMIKAKHPVIRWLIMNCLPLEVLAVFFTRSPVCQSFGPWPSGTVEQKIAKDAKEVGTARLS
jgi:hypothetical protein